MPTDRLRAFRGHVHLAGCIVTGDARRPCPYRSYTAYLTDGKPPAFPGACIVKLNGVTLTRLDARGFVLTGTETGSHHERYAQQPQAWFCRPVDGEARPTPKAP